jgi:hypothetical protein
LKIYLCFNNEPFSFIKYNSLRMHMSVTFRLWSILNSQYNIPIFMLRFLFFQGQIPTSNCERLEPLQYAPPFPETNLVG